MTASGLPLVQGGKLRALGVTTAKRVRAAPDVPTIAEAGVPGYDTSSWFAFFVPAKTPPEIIRKMHDDTVAVLAEPAIAAKLEQQGLIPVGSTPEALSAHFKAEMEMGAGHQGRRDQGRRLGDDPPRQQIDGTKIETRWRKRWRLDRSAWRRRLWARQVF